MKKGQRKVEKKYGKNIEKAKRAANRSDIALKANLEASSKTGPINEHNTTEWNNFNKTYEKILNQRTGEFFENNKYYQKADSLAKKYDMYSWSDLAKENRQAINDFEKGKGFKVNY